MNSLFNVGGNPFASPVGQKIEQATDGSLASENWALNMEICDIINETEEGPKDAIKAIRKRLQQSVGKNYTIVMYTLTVLETCVKNCGKRFHILVCNKEFVMELVKLIGPKNEPPTAVQEKVLNLIQSWADAFYQHTELSGVVQIYQELKIKGIQFPMTDLDTMAPIHTPQKSVKDSGLMAETGVGRVGDERSPASPGGGPQSHQVALPTSPAPPVPVAVTHDQMSKLKHELDIVQNNMTVFSEMLNELNPASEHPSDWQLLEELYSTCKEMQERLVELISRLSSDEVTAELLRINDLLNNLFLRYGRYAKKREAANASDTARVSTGAASLIDLGDETSPATAAAASQLPSQMAALGLGSQLAKVSSIPAQAGGGAKPEAGDSEFDMFAQSRNVTYESSKSGGSTYESNRKPDQVSGNLGAAAEARAQGTQNVSSMHKESDFDEMAAWLGESGGGEESLTSSEFERFLAERAAAAEALPPPGSTASPARKSKEQEESSLFAL